MKRTFHWATAFTVAASMTALAQHAGLALELHDLGAFARSDGHAAGVPAIGHGDEQRAPPPRPVAPEARRRAAPAPAVPAQPAAPAPTAGTQGATAQSGQAAGAGRMGGYASSAAASMYTLRVTDGGGASRTGMPSTAGQADERSAAGQQGGRVYHLMADSSTDLSKHVGHQVEVTGTLSSAGAGGHHGMSSSARLDGQHGDDGQRRGGGGSGSTGYTGQATSGSGSTGSGAAGGTGATERRQHLDDGVDGVAGAGRHGRHAARDQPQDDRLDL